MCGWWLVQGAVEVWVLPGEGPEHGSPTQGRQVGAGVGFRDCGDALEHGGVGGDGPPGLSRGTVVMAVDGCTTYRPVCTCRMASRSAALGRPKNTSRSKRPGLRSAGSMASGLRGTR